MIEPLVIKEPVSEQLNMALIFNGKETFRYSAWERVAKKNLEHYQLTKLDGNKVYGKIGSYVQDKFKTDDVIEDEYDRAYQTIKEKFPHLKNTEMLLYVNGDIFECAG